MASSDKEIHNDIQEEEEEDYLSQLCKDTDNTNSDEHVDHVGPVSCGTPAKISKTTEDFESSLSDQQEFDQNKLSTSSPKLETNNSVELKTNSVATITDHDLTEELSQDNVEHSQNNNELSNRNNEHSQYNDEHSKGNDEDCQYDNEHSNGKNEHYQFNNELSSENNEQIQHCQLNNEHSRGDNDDCRYNNEHSKGNNEHLTDQENTGTVGGKSNEAEEIVKKLCKNGKIMHFQEGEDFIKVIVYEDSQESNDLDDTLSAEELDNTADDKKDQNPGSTKNLLQCLTENTAASRYEGVCSTPLQPYPVGGHYPVSVGNAVQFVRPVHSNIQPSYSLTSSGDVIQTGNMMNHFNIGAMPVSMDTSQHCTPHPRNGYMFYRPTDGQDSKYTMPGGMPTYQTLPVSSGKKISSQLQLNSSGEEQQVSPTDLKHTPTSGRGKLQPKVRALMQQPLPPFPAPDEWGKIREQHNQKERRRRARIKEACNLLRQLVPGMSDKTDKATVFEFAARYVHFLKSHTGTQFDKDFLMKYSPY